MCIQRKKNAIAKLLHTLDALNHFTKTCTIVDVIGSKISSSIILCKQFLFRQITIHVFPPSRRPTTLHCLCVIPV